MGKIVSLVCALVLLFLSDIDMLYSVCNPDQSIIQQKSKKLTPPQIALLVQILRDKLIINWPVEVCKFWISSLFGQSTLRFHTGIDLAASKGTPVYAAAQGIVSLVQNNTDIKGYGNMILIAHNAGYKTRYAHLEKIMVSQNDVVEQGQQIGTVGSTGHVIGKTAGSDPSHLHFELYQGNVRINPLLALFATDNLWLQQQKLQGV